MDSSRDLINSSISSRDGGGGDDDGVIAASYGLGREAYALFTSRRMNECIDVLHRLLQIKKNDQKVLHNLIVAEYYRDGCSDPRKVLEDLNNIKKTCNNRARASEEQLEALGNYGNSISGSKGSGANHQLSASDTSIGYIDEYDTSITTHNIAVVLFHLHEYANAHSVLQPVYQNIEPIEEPIAVQICLLLVDIALASKNATRALEILLYLEKTFGVGYLNSQGDNSSNIQPHNSHLPLKTHSAPTNSTSLDISTSDNNSSSTPRENSLVRTLSDENYENFLSTLDSCDQNLQKPPGFSSSNDVTKTQAPPSLEQSVPDLDLKLKLHLYKVRLLVLTRNLKAAKREVKNFMNIARGRDSSTALLLKSELEYARGNYRKAVRLLMTSSNRTEPGMAGMFNNNLGCIYHQLNKHHAATVLYSKALKSCSQLRSSDKPLKLLTFSQDQSLMIVYNCGLQYLICGKPIIAAQCFQKAGLVYSDKPLLWLRIAECCFLVEPAKNKDVNVRVVGEGKWRQLALDDDEPTKNTNFEEQKNKLSITFARQCLLNALHLLNTSESKFAQSSGLPRDVEDDSSSNYKANGETKDSKAAGNLNMIVHSSVSVYEHRCRTQNHLIKQAVLADLAYSELTLSNPLKALSASRELLNLEECSRIYMFLGRIYAAEALCHLNRLEEAAEYLSVYIPDGINVDIPYSEKDSEQWVASENSLDESSSGNLQNLLLKPSEATGAVYVNFAAMLAMQGHLEQAHIVVRKALDIIPNNRHAILCAAYVDLLMGKAHQALGLLKECSSHVRFLPAGLKL
ncbi:hypothetical protein ACHQM5_028991 [Ranunculus cassubicifolius]